jgi:hypothetical protein
MAAVPGLPLRTVIVGRLEVGVDPLLGLLGLATIESPNRCNDKGSVEHHRAMAHVFSANRGPTAGRPTARQWGRLRFAGHRWNVFSGFDGRRHGLVVFLFGYADACPCLQIRGLAGVTIAGNFGVLGHCVTMLMTFAARGRELVANHTDNLAVVRLASFRHDCLLGCGL